jgi:hypothetical protein
MSSRGILRGIKSVVAVWAAIGKAFSVRFSLAGLERLDRINSERHNQIRALQLQIANIPTRHPSANLMIPVKNANVRIGGHTFDVVQNVRSGH